MTGVQTCALPICDGVQTCSSDLKTVTLTGWVQKNRKMGGMTFIDLRDRYGITQLVFNQDINPEICERANRLGREYVIQATGTVAERSNKNLHIMQAEEFL